MTSFWESSYNYCLITSGCHFSSWGWVDLMSLRKLNFLQKNLKCNLLSQRERIYLKWRVVNTKINVIILAKLKFTKKCIADLFRKNTTWLYACQMLLWCNTCRSILLFLAFFCEILPKMIFSTRKGKIVVSEFFVLIMYR